MCDKYETDSYEIAQKRGGGGGGGGGGGKPRISCCQEIACRSFSQCLSPWFSKLAVHVVVYYKHLVK